jgi:hypothetical protein
VWQAEKGRNLRDKRALKKLTGFQHREEFLDYGTTFIGEEWVDFLEEI